MDLKYRNQKILVLVLFFLFCSLWPVGAQYDPQLDFLEWNDPRFYDVPITNIKIQLPQINNYTLPEFESITSIEKFNKIFNRIVRKKGMNKERRPILEYHIENVKIEKLEKLSYNNYKIISLKRYLTSIKIIEKSKSRYIQLVQSHIPLCDNINILNEGLYSANCFMDSVHSGPLIEKISTKDATMELYNASETLNVFLFTDHNLNNKSLTLTGKVKMWDSILITEINKHFYPFDNYLLYFEIIIPFDTFIEIKDLDVDDIEVIADETIKQDYVFLPKEESLIIKAKFKRPIWWNFFFPLLVALAPFFESLFWREYKKRFTLRLFNYIIIIILIFYLSIPPQGISSWYFIRVMIFCVLAFSILSNEMLIYKPKLGFYFVKKLIKKSSMVFWA
jgi:hypothetical protein